MSTTAPPPSIASTPFRQDAQVIGLVGTAHMISHFSQLLLAPLFPWLKVEFNVSYAELGFLMTIFFAVSCGVQALSGFLVDRVGPRPAGAERVELQPAFFAAAAAAAASEAALRSALTFAKCGRSPSILR